LGPEPFEDKFDLKYFRKFIKNKNKKVKDLLIDQKFVSGIGNIYASEILFLSGINPNRKIKLLNNKNCTQIIKNSKKILLNAIQKGGSSIRNFKNTDGYQGNFQNNFKVYQREGLNCKRINCKGEIIKKVISNRSSFFCNSCQK
jgi:formamidopyrimidine-DNA glycosylase